MTKLEFTATSLEDIAREFDRLAVDSAGVWAKAETVRQHYEATARKNAFEEAAAILRATKLEPVAECQHLWESVPDRLGVHRSTCRHCGVKEFLFRNDEVASAEPEGIPLYRLGQVEPIAYAQPDGSFVWVAGGGK